MDIANDYNEQLLGRFGNYDSTLNLSNYKYPNLDLLEKYDDSVPIDEETVEFQKNTIVETFNYSQIEILSIKAAVGPTLTLYEFIPSPGVRVSKIKALKSDLALQLAAEITITGPIPGRGTMGIEVPHRNRGIVSIRSILATEQYQHCNFDLPIALGKSMDNMVFLADLTQLPHLLIAGATGQGKSVCLNAILMSLLYKKHPSQVKFVLIDINRLEFSLFENIEKHFLAKLPGKSSPIISDKLNAIDTLNSLVLELDQRYSLLKNAAVRHMKDYNQKFISRRLNPDFGNRYLPYIVVVIDEFAELLTTDKEADIVINRLAQLGRAAGIHLIISTQRPSVKIITGTIKANFPARLAFRVSSNIDSRTILECSGAELLNGHGDMLLSTGAELIHLQGAYVDTIEVDRVSEFIGNQRGYPEAYALQPYGVSLINSIDIDYDDIDSMFEDAARLIVLHQQGSTSLIQRKLKLGYNRASRIINQLEAAGVIGPFEGSKAREVLLPDEYALERFLENLKSPCSSAIIPNPRNVETLKIEPEVIVAESTDPVPLQFVPLESESVLQEATVNNADVVTLQLIDGENKPLKTDKKLTNPASLTTNIFREVHKHNEPEPDLKSQDPIATHSFKTESTSKNKKSFWHRLFGL